MIFSHDFLEDFHTIFLSVNLLFQVECTGMFCCCQFREKNP